MSPGSELGVSSNLFEHLAFLDLAFLVSTVGFADAGLVLGPRFCECLVLMYRTTFV